MFDKYIASVLNYGAEVWGFHTGKDVERVHTNFFKLILRVFSSTPDFMIHTELGRLTLIIFKKIKIPKYWMKNVYTQNCILKKTYMRIYIPPNVKKILGFI